MAYTTVALQNLAVLVRARRTALQLSLDEAARRAVWPDGKVMSNATWKRVEEAKGVRDTTYVRVDAVLGWVPGSCLAILNGSTAEPVAGELVGGVRVSRLPDAEVVGTTVQSAVIATAPELTGAQITALSERVVADLRKLGLFDE